MAEKSLLHLSLLSRGVGQVKRNGHEKVDVVLEAQDYFNYRHGRRFYIPTVQQSQAIANESGAPNGSIPKTYTTRKGALVIFSEEEAERAKQRAKKDGGGQTRKTGTVDPLEALLKYTDIMGTVEDLANAVLTYGAKNSKIDFRFIKDSRSIRPVRPGYSAKRYLSRFLRNVDMGFFDSMLEKGYVCESSIFTTNKLLPHIRRRIDDDLSCYPEPYRILHQMLWAPGLLTGYSFYSEISEEDSNHDEIHGGAGGAGRIEKNKEVMHYENLSPEAKETALADVLLKSAISQALELHTQNLTFDASGMEERPEKVARRPTRLKRSNLNTLGKLNMVDAVKTYLESQAAVKQQTNAFIDIVSSVDKPSRKSSVYESESSVSNDDVRSFVSSRKSSIDGTSSSVISSRRSSADRKGRHGKRRIMTPITDVDSNAAYSREVTFNRVPILPPIESKDYEELQHISDAASERDSRRCRDFPMPHVGFSLSGSSENLTTRDSNFESSGGETSGRSLKNFKAGSHRKQTKGQQSRNSNRRPKAKQDFLPGTGSVILMPGGEVVQVGQTITLTKPMGEHGLGASPASHKNYGANPGDVPVVRELADKARQLASLVLANPDAGLDLNKDALEAARLWDQAQFNIRSNDKLSKVPPIVSRANKDDTAVDSLKTTIDEASQGNERSASEYRAMLEETLQQVVSRSSGLSPESIKAAGISPDLMRALIQREVSFTEIELSETPSGKSVIRIRGSSGGNIEMGVIEVDLEGIRMGGASEVNSVNQSSLNSEQYDRSFKVGDDAETMGSIDQGRHNLEDGGQRQTGDRSNRSGESKRDEVALDGSETKGNASGKMENPSKYKSNQMQQSNTTSKEREEFVVGKFEDKKELSKLYGRQDEAIKRKTPTMSKETKKKKTKKTKTKKGSSDGESKQAEEDQSNSDNNRGATTLDAEGFAANEAITQISDHDAEPEVKKSEPEEIDFVFVKEEFSEDDDDKQPEAKSVAGSDKVQYLSPTKSVSVGEESGSDASAYISDSSASNRSERNKQKRDEKAERKRREVEQKRRDREEQMRREKEEAERMAKLQRELDEERFRLDEAKRLERERREEQMRRMAEEKLALEQRARLEAEKERRMKEEYARKLEALRRRQAEEDELKRALEEQRLKEEEERRILEELALAEMEEEERKEYLRKQEEEKEKQRKRREEERLRREEEQRKAMEEAMRMAQELARKEEELRQRLLFHQSLHSEASHLSQAHNVSRAFVYSYFELLEWLGMSLPDDPQGHKSGKEAG